MKKSGFTIPEILIATFVLVFTATATFVLLGSAAQFAGHRAHRYEAFEDAAQTLDTLKEYVSRNNTDSIYRLTGDPSPPCGGGPVNRYALRDPNPAAWVHCHPLPSGAMRDQLGGRRTYTVVDVELNSAFDSDNDGNPGNDSDVKRVTVTIDWNEPR